jgi:hypothetical protein
MKTNMLIVTMQGGQRAFFAEAGQPVEWRVDAEGRRNLEETISQLVAGEGNLGDLSEVYGEGWHVNAIEIVEVRTVEAREYRKEN